MVTNSYNRRRANKGTPPICLTKDPPPPPVPDPKCICTLQAAYHPPLNTIRFTITVGKSIPTAVCQVNYTIKYTPAIPGSPQMGLTNCGQTDQYDSGHPIPGQTYTIKIECQTGYTLGCWAEATTTVP